MIDFSVPEAQPYLSRKNKSLRLIFIVIGMLFILFWLMGTDLVIASIVLGILFLVQLNKTNDVSRYFITHLRIHNGTVNIVYKDRDEEFTFSGKLEEMKIKKKVVILSRTRKIYLAFYHNKKLLMEQFLVGEWTESKFDEIEQYIRKVEILGNEVG